MLRMRTQESRRSSVRVRINILVLRKCTEPLSYKRPCQYSHEATVLAVFGAKHFSDREHGAHLFWDWIGSGVFSTACGRDFGSCLIARRVEPGAGLVFVSARQESLDLWLVYWTSPVCWVIPSVCVCFHLLGFVAVQQTCAFLCFNRGTVITRLQLLPTFTCDCVVWSLIPSVSVRPLLVKWGWDDRTK